MKRYFILALVAVLVIPAVSHAAILGGTWSLVVEVGRLVNRLTLVVSAIALLAFFWGLTKFISKSGDSKNNAEGKNLMIWGTVALFVMVSVWGLVRFIGTEVGVTDGNNYAPNIPTLPPY